MGDQQLTGILLAGGRARRMGGGDKGLLPLAGLPLAQWTLATLAPQVGTLYINANRHFNKYAAFGFPVVADIIDGYPGPLAGIHAGMMRADSDWILSAPCDSPFLPINLGEQLLTAAVVAQADIAVATAGGRTQPVFMVAKSSLAKGLAVFLNGGDGKIEHWYKAEKFVEVAFPDAAAFDNINTPAELAAAEKRLSK